MQPLPWNYSYTVYFFFSFQILLFLRFHSLSTLLFTDSTSPARIRKFWTCCWKRNVTINVYCRQLTVSPAQIFEFYKHMQVVVCVCLRIWMSVTLQCPFTQLENCANIIFSAIYVYVCVWSSFLNFFHVCVCKIHKSV